MSRSVVQRKFLLSFYHSSLSCIFFPAILLFSLYFGPPIIPSLPHLLALLSHRGPIAPLSASHLRLCVCRLPVCVLAVWVPSCQKLLCTCTCVFVPASVSACICVLVKKACIVKVALLCHFLLFCCMTPAEVGNEEKKIK